VMKKFILIFVVISLILSSCKFVQFENSQPVDAKELATFPKNMIGEYLGQENDTLIITSKWYKIGKDKEEFLSPRKIVLKKFKSYYVLNYYEEKDWDVLLLKINRENLTVYAIDFEKEEKTVINDLKKILPVKEYNEPGNSKSYVINPTKKEFRLLVKKKQFKPIGTYIRIK
jgi:hypothetical protein